MVAPNGLQEIGRSLAVLPKFGSERYDQPKGSDPLVASFDVGPFQEGVIS
jgi:hypothetical protein